MLGQRWQHQRWRHAGQRWKQWLVLYLLSLVIGCEIGFQPEAQYSAAHHKLTQGFFDAASQEAHRGRLQTERRDPLWSWKFKILEAEAGLRNGNPKQSLDLLAQEPPPNLPPELPIRRKILQGEAFCRLNQATQAETTLGEAEQLIPPARSDLQAELALTRGRCALSINRAAAKQYFAKAAKFSHGGDRFVEGISLLNGGFVLLQEQHYSEAIDLLNQALAVSDSYWVRQKALGNLADCYAELGDWRQSLSLAEQAEQLAAQIKNNADRKRWLIDMGRAQLVLREYDKAEPRFIQALAIARELKDEDAIARCLNNLTQLALRRHDLQTAEQYSKEESSLKLGSEGTAYVTFDAATIAIEKKDYPQAERLFGDVLGAKINNSLRFTTQRELGNVYWQEKKLVEADRTFLKAIDDAETTICKLPPEHRMSFLDVDPFYDSYVRFLVSQDRPADALKIAERGRAQILSQALGETSCAQPTFALTAIQAGLKNRGQIALAYSLTDDESFLWVITPAQIKLFRLLSHRQLRPLIDAYNHEVVDNPRPIENSPGGQELYKTLVQPAEALIPKGSRVVVIASKILSLVNFEALVVPSDHPRSGDHPHYWIEDVEIQTASSLSLLTHSRPENRTAKSKKQLFLLGAPLEADSSFPVLKHADEEMARVRSHFPNGQETVISGKDAVPSAYSASHPGDYRLIHIDAHSSPSDLSPLDSYLVLSPGKDKDSHKLSAREIARTPLTAELVTISACYGAGTRWYQGEGIVGLGWAFRRAGARQVVASLWAVDDASTPQLMDDFYDALSKGKPASTALRDAKLRMLQSNDFHKRPYYWASLQLYTGG